MNIGQEVYFINTYGSETSREDHYAYIEVGKFLMEDSKITAIVTQSGKVIFVPPKQVTESKGEHGEIVDAILESQRS